ncbi:hypothetical protein ACFLYN_02505 [Chloroflexota bacterium]
MTIAEIFKDAPLQERTTNYKQLAQNIAGDYGYTHSPLSERISHGIQKDAIQNGWDACEKKTKNYIQQNWAFEFELTEIHNNKILIMTDYGTCGLTGDLATEDLKKLDIAAEDLPEYERWARWESFGFTKTEGLGARGQGKMIFILGSQDYSIFYDSLRSDGSYRFGGSIATETGCPVFHYNDSEAKKLIKEKLGIIPISHQGTRIMIINPVEELIEDIENGNLLRYIEETWWPNILKYDAQIIVKNKGNTTKARIPDKLPISHETQETNTFKKWIKEADDYKKTGLKIKRLHVACNKEEEVDELVEGISCFRDGMKVDIIRFPIKSYRKKVYGYIEFEPELEAELREKEKPTHYAFKGTSWNKIKSLVEQELEAFANIKLGLGIDSQAVKNLKRNNAESKAMTILKALTKNWPLSKLSKGSGGGGNGGTPSDKDIGIRLSELLFPNIGNIPRLDYGQKLEGFKVIVNNKTSNEFNVTMNGYILSGDKKIMDIRNESFILKPKSREVFSDNIMEVTKHVFKSAGIYRIRFHLIDNTKNVRLDEITRRIWVESDPELAGPFDVQRISFFELPEELNVNKSKEWILSPEGDNRYTLYYNQDHPAYLSNDDTETRLIGYLAELFLMGAIELLIRQESIKEDVEQSKKELPIEIDMLKSSSPLESYNECILALSKLRENIYGNM